MKGKKTGGEKIKASRATEAELKAGRIRCWSPLCKNKAWLIDWAGWHWCLRHWYNSWRWGGGEVSIKSFIYELKNTKVYL